MLARISRIKLLEPASLVLAICLVLYVVISVSGRTIIPVLIAFSASISILAFTLKRPEYLVLSFFFLLPFSLENPEGVTAGELAFLSLAVIIAFIFFFLPVITGRIKIETPLDKMFLIFTLLLPIASILGLLHGANLYASIGELTYFTGILIYFALRHYLDKESFQKSLLFVFTLVLIFVIVRNFYNYQEIILQAYLPWQVEKARVTSNEVLILFFTTLCTSSFVYSKNLKQTVFSLLFLGGGFLSLILTQSRGYWLAFLISFSVVFIFVSAKKKNRMVLYFSIILALTLGIAKIYFSDFFDLIFNAILIRFESISTSAQVDISLLERFQESATVFSKIAINPILGYGFGTEYVKFIFFERIHISTSYIHNGYLAAWYKLGLPGLLILLGICVSIFRNSFRIFKNSELLINKVLGLTIMATLAGMMLVNNTSPQFLALDSIVLLTVMGAYCSEFSQSKYMRSSRS